jgi:triphosphatase
MSGAEYAAGSPLSYPKTAARLIAGAQPVRLFLESALSRAVRLFEKSLAAFQQQQQVETVHNLRVAARKLRGTIALLQRLAPAEHSEQLKRLAHQAKEVAQSLAEAREADVLLNGLHGEMVKNFKQAGAEELVSLMERHRAASYSKATSSVFGTGDRKQSRVRSPASVAPRQGKQFQQALTARKLQEEAQDVAVGLLDHLLRRVKKRARSLDKFDDAKRHRLRIAVKNLRYGLELFAPLFPADESHGRYLSRVIRLHDDLGTCNDAVASRRTVMGILEGEKGPAHHAAKAFLDGLDERAEMTRRKLKRRMRRLRQTKAFWRS